MTAFALTFDYRCPFARNANEHVLAGLAGGADWDVTFLPFSLGQVHVEEGQSPIWDRPAEDSGLLALQVGVAVRDEFPDAFRAVHHALFALRHDRAQQLNDEGLLRSLLADHGVDAEKVFTLIAEGGVLATIRAEHEAAARDHDVWGVPTFIAGDDAVFVRLMDRPGDDHAHARASIDKVLALLGGFPELNEYKHTSLSA